MAVRALGKQRRSRPFAQSIRNISMPSPATTGLQSLLNQFNADYLNLGKTLLATR